VKAENEEFFSTRGKCFFSTSEHNGKNHFPDPCALTEHVTKSRVMISSKQPVSRFSRHPVAPPTVPTRKLSFLHLNLTTGLTSATAPVGSNYLRRAFQRRCIWSSPVTSVQAPVRDSGRRMVLHLGNCKLVFGFIYCAQLWGFHWVISVDLQPP
jgi:hypothetical protein